MRYLSGALVTVAVITAGAFAAASAHRFGPQRPPTGLLADALAGRVAQLMETDFRAEIGGGEAPVRCAARAFGARPEGLLRAVEASTVYAWVYCRGQGAELLAPVAVRFDRPPSVRIPRPGRDRNRDIRRIFPADVRDALRGTDTGALRGSLGG